MRNIAVHLAVAKRATVRLDRAGRDARLVFEGDWLLGEAERMDKMLRTLNLAGISQIGIDGSKLSHLDSAGAWLILRTRHLLEAKGTRVINVILPEAYQALYRRLESEALVQVSVHPRRR